MMKRCKKLAREQQVTFRTLVEEGLEKVMAERSKRKPFKLRTVAAGRGGFQPGFDESGWDRMREAIYEGRGA